MTTATFPIAGFGLLGKIPTNLSAKPKKMSKAERRKRVFERIGNLSRPLIGMSEINDMLRYLELVESEFVAALSEFAELVTAKELEEISDSASHVTLVDSFSVIETIAGSEKYEQLISVARSMDSMFEWVRAQTSDETDRGRSASISESVAYNESFSKFIQALLGLIAISSMINDDDPSWPTDSLMHLIDAVDDLMDDAEVSLLGTRPANYDLKESQPMSVLADVL